MLYLLDLLGTWMFALYGAHKARKYNFDIFGIATIALVSGLGGGTVRDLFLNATPAYLSDPVYILAVLAGVLVALLPDKFLNQFSNFMLTVDAVGLVAFAYIGSAAAEKAGMGFLGSVFFATITAVGGSVLRDISMKKIPEIFYQDFYATPAILLGGAYFFFRPYLQTGATPFILMAAAFILRMLAIKYKIQLWKPSTE